VLLAVLDMQAVVVVITHQVLDMLEDEVHFQAVVVVELVLQMLQQV
jgi:hypothetical protein